jgi:hypothetical protein
MSDEGAPPTAAPASSLSPEMLEAKQTLERSIADPASDYHRDPALREHLGDLIRAELAGAAEPVGPEFDPALDPPPLHPGGYDLSGLAIYDAETRSLADSFASAAHAGGLGQQHVRAAVAWALAQTEQITPASFQSWAVRAGWSDHAIAVARAWHAGGGAPSGGSANAAQAATIGAAELPYIDLGNRRLAPNPAWRR